MTDIFHWFKFLFMFVSSVLGLKFSGYFIFLCRYTEDGHTVGEPEMTPPNPIRLEWELPQPVSLFVLRAKIQ